MLRFVSNIRTVTSITDNLQSLTTVRWARKPPWLPKAKSKIFRVSQRGTYPVEETEEVKRLFNNYRTAMKSVRKYLFNRYNVSLQAKADIEQLQKDFEEDLARCRVLNDEWNETVRMEREKRVNDELERDIEFAKKRMLELLQAKETEMALAEEMVRREKIAVASFIRIEDLDEVIEKAINNPVDYNFAIDLEGNRIMGRETRPDNPQS